MSPAVSELRTRGGLWFAASLVLLILAVHFDLHKTPYVFYLFSALFAAVSLSAFKCFGIRAVLLVVLFCGAFYVKNAPIYSPIDEVGHFGYVHHIAKHGRLPLLHVYLDDEMLAFAKKTYPQPTDSQASDMGLAGRYYQAFQPPLYYLLAAVLYRMAGDNLRTKVYVLRAFGLVLLVIAVYVALRAYELLIARKVMERDDFLFFSVLLLLAITPGILNHMTTVSNLHLQIPMASLFLWSLLKYRLTGKDGAASVWVPSLICGLTVMLNIAVLVYIAIFAQFMIVHGRYLYMSQLALAVLLYMFMRNAPWSPVSVLCVALANLMYVAHLRWWIVALTKSDRLLARIIPIF